MSVYNVVQRIRKILGLSHSYVDKSNGGSGSVTVIPLSPEANRGTVSLHEVSKHEVYRKYDPIPYNRFDIPLGTGKVSKHYNQMCSQVGLQAVVRMDPIDWKTLYEFKNVSEDKLIRIRWSESKQNHEVLLEPGEQTTLKLGGNIEDTQAYPEVKAFEYGVK